MAPDYFMFSYYRNGLNLKDILLLKKVQETITRAKTKNTAKKEVRLDVNLNQHQLDFIRLHQEPGEYLFNVFSDGNSDEIIEKKLAAKLSSLAKQMKNQANQLDDLKVP